MIPDSMCALAQLVSDVPWHVSVRDLSSAETYDLLRFGIVLCSKSGATIKILVRPECESVTVMIENMRTMSTDELRAVRERAEQVRYEFEDVNFGRRDMSHDWNVHPGEILAERLAARFEAQHEVKAGDVIDIVSRYKEACITSELAELFAQELGATAEFWLELQRLYDDGPK